MIALLRRIYRRLSGRDPLPRLIRRGLTVGRNFFFQDGCVIDASHCSLISIGDDVSFGPNVTVLAHDASMKRALGYVRLGKVAIGDRVFVGAGSLILPGVCIGADSIVGAGSVVTRNVPAGCVVAGNPARELCTTKDFLERQQSLLASSPCFGREFTLAGGVTPERLAEMGQRMGSGSGYIV